MDVTRSSKTGAGSTSPRPFGLRSANLLLLLAGVVVVLFGYVILGRGSIIAAPLLLVAGYVVLIPAGLLLGFGRVSGDEGGEPGE
jgi:hypothetical protein